MPVVFLLARLLLATVFIAAAIAKLRDRGGSRQALVDFGVPASLAPALGVVLPFSELAVALALFPASTAIWGATGALLLLVAFTAAIATHLARGHAPHCHCFGQLSSGPVGWSTLARNSILALIAGFLVWRGASSPPLSALDSVGLVPPGALARVGEGAGLALLALVAALLVQVLRQQGRILLRIEGIEARLAAAGPAATHPEQPLGGQVAGLPPGSKAPVFRLKGLRGEPATLEALLEAGKPLVLLFLHPACGPCRDLMPDVGQWQRDHAGTATFAVISEGRAKQNRIMATQFGITRVLLQRKREIADAYQAYGTPGAVLVRPDGSIGSPLALGTDAVRALVTQLLSLGDFLQPMVVPQPNQNSAPNGQGEHGVIPLVPARPRVGDTAPQFELPDLTGRTIALGTFRGRETVVLFWNPHCGFCQQMLPDLRAWEAQPATRRPGIVLVSSGTAEDNRAMGLRSPIVLDAAFQTGSAFGAGGTPTAVLIDADGRIASELAVGADAVQALVLGSDPGFRAAALKD